MLCASFVPLEGIQSAVLGLLIGLAIYLVQVFSLILIFKIMARKYKNRSRRKRNYTIARGGIRL